MVARLKRCGQRQRLRLARGGGVNLKLVLHAFEVDLLVEAIVLEDDHEHDEDTNVDQESVDHARCREVRIVVGRGRLCLDSRAEGREEKEQEQEQEEERRCTGEEAMSSRHDEIRSSKRVGNSARRRSAAMAKNSFDQLGHAIRKPSWAPAKLRKSELKLTIFKKLKVCSKRTEKSGRDIKSSKYDLTTTLSRIENSYFDNLGEDAVGKAVFASLEKAFITTTTAMTQ
eukprot:scaffold3296_cov159-Ochromonas_danica.AAC.22